MEGEFSCQARNLAGLGQKCNIKVSGPVSTLLAETDISVIIISACFLVFLVVMISLSVIICRRINKLDPKLAKCSLKILLPQNVADNLMMAGLDNF